MDQVVALQPLLIGAVLIWAGFGKVYGRLAEARARRSALPRLVGDQRALGAYRMTGRLELLVGAALLLPPWWLVDGVAASLLGLGFVGYLGYARVAAPDASCGCLGSAALPVSWRSIARAVALLVASASIVTADAGWPEALLEERALAGAIVAAELAVFVGLSPELDRWWLVPLRRAYVRLTHPLAGAASTEIPLAASVQQLQRSPAYRGVAGLLRSDVRDHWDDGDWRILCFTAAHGNGSALAVFAIPRGQYDPEAVRVAIVDEATGAPLTPA